MSVLYLVRGLVLIVCACGIAGVSAQSGDVLCFVLAQPVALFGGVSLAEAHSAWEER
jgi:hypothetical protein